MAVCCAPTPNPDNQTLDPNTSGDSIRAVISTLEQGRGKPSKEVRERSLTEARIQAPGPGDFAHSQTRHLLPFLRNLLSTFYPNMGRSYPFRGWYKYTHNWNYS